MVGLWNNKAFSVGIEWCPSCSYIEREKRRQAFFLKLRSLSSGIDRSKSGLVILNISQTTRVKSQTLAEPDVLPIYPAIVCLSLAIRDSFFVIIDIKAMTLLSFKKSDAFCLPRRYSIEPVLRIHLSLIFRAESQIIDAPSTHPSLCCILDAPSEQSDVPENNQNKHNWFHFYF